jgi:hypothetical protein
MNLKIMVGLTVLGLIGALLGNAVLFTPVKGAEPWTGNITINSDGSFSPSNAPIKINNGQYKLTADLAG